MKTPDDPISGDQLPRNPRPGGDDFPPLTDRDASLLADWVDGARSEDDPAILDLLARYPDLADEVADTQNLAAAFDTAGVQAQAEIQEARGAKLDPKLQADLRQLVDRELGAGSSAQVASSGDRRPQATKRFQPLLAVAAAALLALGFWAGNAWQVRSGDAPSPGEDPDFGERVLSGNTRADGFVPAAAGDSLETFRWGLTARPGEFFVVRVFESADARSRGLPPRIEGPEVDSSTWRPDATDAAELQQLDGFVWELVRQRADGTDLVESVIEVRK